MSVRPPKAREQMVSSQISTRKAYGTALAKLGRYNERVVALDGDTNNLTFSEIFKNEHPNRYVECYIAQQNMVCSPLGYIHFSFSNLLILFSSDYYYRKNSAIHLYSYLI